MSIGRIDDEKELKKEKKSEGVCLVCSFAYVGGFFFFEVNVRGAKKVEKREREKSCPRVPC